MSQASAAPPASPDAWSAAAFWIVSSKRSANSDAAASACAIVARRSDGESIISCAWASASTVGDASSPSATKSKWASAPRAAAGSGSKGDAT